MRCALIVVVGLVAAGATHAGPFDHPTASSGPVLGYSRWNYWAPALVRVKAHFEPKTIPLYASDRYPGVPNPVGIVYYPKAAVPPAAYYQGTGLSYDPLGPFAVYPPAAAR